ncbi:MAG: ferredoxin [Coriobacteriales bacterium]|nr:ferredoxin [Coriobacteriales bacterium]
MKPVVDEDLCIACGQCEEICPEVFVLEDVARVIVESPGPELYGCCRDAADACPTEAITITEE